MTEPSAYELDAWRNIQRFQGRPLTRVVRDAGEKVATGAAELGKRAKQYLEDRPRAQAVVSRGQDFFAKSAQTIGSAKSKAAGALPEGLSDWSGAALGSVRQTVGRVSRVGLSPRRW